MRDAVCRREVRSDAARLFGPRHNRRRERRNRHFGIQQIAAASQRSYETAGIVAELLAQFVDALNERVIRYGNTGPHRLVKLLLWHEPAGVFGEVAKNLERLGAQVDIVVAGAQKSPRQIKRKRSNRSTPWVSWSIRLSGRRHPPPIGKI
jgi:hypothetical protein